MEARWEENRPFQQPKSSGLVKRAVRQHHEGATLPHAAPPSAHVLLLQETALPVLKSPHKFDWKFNQAPKIKFPGCHTREGLESFSGKQKHLKHFA